MTLRTWHLAAPGVRTGRRRRVLLAAAVAVASIAVPVGSGSAQGASRTTGTVASDGSVRTYRLYVPGSLRPGSQRALVLVLHGFGGSAAQAERAYGWDAEASRHGFVVAYPQGLRRAWNDAGLDRQPKVDDVAFLVRLIDRLSTRFAVEPGRVYVAGMSNGGFMAERLACDAADRLAAIGAVAASRRAACAPSRPVSVMHVHGLEDPLVAWAGSAGGPIGAYRSQPAIAAGWRAVDDCGAVTVAGTGGKVRRETAEGCAEGTGVVLVTIASAVHEWPGATRAPTSAATYDTTAELWRFFAAHPRT